MKMWLQVNDDAGDNRDIVGNRWPGAWVNSVEMNL